MANTGGGCSGQGTAFLKDFKANIIPCPKCGREVEFFTDEKKVICPKCGSSIFMMDPQAIEYNEGRLVFKGSGKSCFDWCGGCINKRDREDIEENKKRIKAKKEGLKMLIESVSGKDVKIINFFIEAFRKSYNTPELIDDRIFDMLSKHDPDLLVKARDCYQDFLNRQS